MTESIDPITSTREALQWNIEELTTLAEDIQVHHAERDGDWLRPEELRELLRQMYYSLLGLYELSREASSDQ